MDQPRSFHPASPLLARCQPSLPAVTYYDPHRFAEEQKLIWQQTWVYACRANDLSPLTVRRVSVGGQNLILVRDEHGEIRCFHNTCRHRGSELCAAHETELKSRLITCPYHRWSYSLSGRLVAMPHVVLTEAFPKDDHGLFPAHVHEWNGFVFVCLADEAPDFAQVPDVGKSIYDNWPMRDLVTGHSMVTQLACNWKIFWENFNECLHCPGIHPDLCDMVPVYGRGIMAHESAADWSPEAARPQHNLRPGARTWTRNGKPCGPEFPGLSEAERSAGYHFATLLPTMFIVAHVDYVRAVSMRPIGPESTELKVEWLFPRATLEAPSFDLHNVVDFAAQVIREDGEACEMNQRGLRCSKYKAGTLVPQEHAIFEFHEWVRRFMKEVRS